MSRSAHLAALSVFASSLVLPLPLRAELELPAIVSDHMVLQQNHENPIWGWDAPGTTVTVEFGDQLKSAEVGESGRWEVELATGAASNTPATITITGSRAVRIDDVLVGEVWMCSGQSNMQWPVDADWKFEVEALASNHPNLRLISVPQVGTQDLQNDFEGEWESADPDTVRDFSAVGFFYGRFLHEILGVPVGLIDNSWGGSAAEAWVRRETLEGDPRFSRLVEEWQNKEADLTSPDAQAKHEAALERWRKEAEAARAEGRNPPRQPSGPERTLTGNHRPGNIFAGVVHPTLGYGIKGVIWYQGESNASRAAEYAELFPFMIEEWRKEWGQGRLPFYWVQLADFMEEKPAPGESAWAELREAQTKTMELPDTGQAVIIDLGEGNDIHPRNKYDVAARLVRWPLARDYGFSHIEPQSPTFTAMAVEENKAVLTFDHVGDGLRTVDTGEVHGFAICGPDHQWKPAHAEIDKPHTVRVWSDEIAEPVAVRYAWADNPACNVYSSNGLPMTPFRTDDFRLTTAAE